VVTAPDPIHSRAWAAVSCVVDPEIPALTIADMGILRDVTVVADRVVVTITPTYTGCPAMGAIRQDVERALEGAGLDGEVRTVLAPAWTTDWMSDEAHAKLEATGIAPPGPTSRCPRCRAGSPRTVSEFGSTACKALMVCTACGEPFDLFKELT
jgi:ring-1,2-phenylacetyl-CoA epoxidase subunit PaaD